MLFVTKLQGKIPFLYSYSDSKMPSGDTFLDITIHRNVPLDVSNCSDTQKEYFCCGYITHNVSNFDMFFVLCQNYYVAIVETLLYQ